MIEAPDSEKVVLSLCIQHPETWLPRAMGEGIVAAYFHTPAHRALWEHVEQLWREDSVNRISLIHVTEDLVASGAMKTWFADPSQLAHVACFAIGEFEGAAAIEKLRVAFTKRRARSAASALSALSEDPLSSSEALEESARAALEAITGAMTGGGRSLTAKEAGKAFLDRWENLRTTNGTPGIATGIDCLDFVTGGPKPGELWTVAAQTSAGKSVLMLQIAGHATRHGKRAMVFSLEMGAGEVAARIMSGTYGAFFPACMNPSGVTKENMEGIRDAMLRFAATEFFVNDDSEITVERIHAEVERAVDRQGLDLVVVDYLQLLNGERRRNERQDEEIGRNVKRLKQIAKKFNLAIITASQLNDEGRLFASRAIGHHSDLVMKITDEGIMMDKQRNGAKGDCLPLELSGINQRFVQTGPFPDPEKEKEKKKSPPPKKRSWTQD